MSLACRKRFGGKQMLALGASLGLLASPGVFAAPGATYGTGSSDNQSSIIASAHGAHHIATTQAPGVRQPTVGAPENVWSTYLEDLKHFTQSQASGQATRALAKAAQADVKAQTGNIDMNFTGNFTDYPNGAGSGVGTNSTFTNLRQYGEARVNWRVLDFFSRRTARIDMARADADQTR